jgi:hypothetical protein
MLGRGASSLWKSLLAILAAWHCVSALADNYSDIWYDPLESGWGLTIADHETNLFAVWYTYQADGSSMWFVIPGGTLSANRTLFTGDIYQTQGPSYAGPFNPNNVVVTKVGTASIDFAPQGLVAGAALFTWTIGSATRTRQIERQQYGNAPAQWASDFTDIWYNPAESGWGLTLAQHGNNVFGVWFTYAPSGQPLFVVMPGVTFSGPSRFSGALYTTTGPAYTSTTFDPLKVVVTPVGNATVEISDSTGTFTSTVNGFTQTKSMVRQAFGRTAPSPIGKYLLASRGVWALFDRRGWPNGYFDGDAIAMFGSFDQDLANQVGASNVASTVGAEIASQMSKMQKVGINTLSFELRATDPVYIPGFTPPTCNLPPSLGLLWPQPSASQLANLRAFLDLALTYGMRVMLILNSTHMEEQPPTNAATWLGAILPAVKDHPALDTIIFGGDEHVIPGAGAGTCGIPAEAPLYLGPTSYAGTYVQWAINYGRSLGVDPRKLSAEAIVGDYYVNQQPGAGSSAQDSHLWSPISVLKTLFDNLGFAASQRTYVLSFYSHRKCLNTHNFNIPCTDADPDTWADQTLQDILSVTGAPANGARIVAAEFGNYAPFAAGWGAPAAFESLAARMSLYGIDGGSYWTWTESDSTVESDPTHPGESVRKRGLNDVYNPVQRELLDAYAFHLASIANPSFELGGAMPSSWTASGSGSASRYFLAGEAGQPLVAGRGSYALRLVSGSGANDQIVAQSDLIATSPSTSYTTTANLRFNWSGDTRTGADPSRPNVFMAINYYVADGSPSAVRAQDAFRLYQEDSPNGFGTFPNAYVTPSDARSVRIVFGIARNGLAQPITLDVDNVR